MSFVKRSLFRGHSLHQVTAGPGHLEYLEYLEQGVCYTCWRYQGPRWLKIFLGKSNIGYIKNNIYIHTRIYIYKIYECWGLRKTPCNSG